MLRVYGTQQLALLLCFPDKGQVQLFEDLWTPQRCGTIQNLAMEDIRHFQSGVSHKWGYPNS
jgi:hypothetical protein